jgi:PBP1b-binding outer membrane lipoprotein LpoB
MKKIIIISLLAIVVFFVGCVLFTPVEVAAGASKTTLWKTLVER